MNVLDLKRKAVDVRKGAITLAHRSKGHIGGTLSSADLLTAVYYRYLRFNPAQPDDPDRDRFILSKGHTCEAYLWTLADCGYFDPRELETFNEFGSRMISHPNNSIPGVELCTGSLGHGLSLGCGIALGARMSRRSFNCYVLMGDGETDEGSVWEAAMFAAANKLDNLYAMVDRNRLQISGSTEEVMPLEPYADKWRAFGFEVAEIDGNCMEEIVETMDRLHQLRGAPKLILAHTVKGKGVSFMENNKDWHHGSLDEEQYQRALHDLDREGEGLKG